MITSLTCADGPIVLAAVGHADHKIHVWQPLSPRPRRTPLQGHRGTVTAMAAVPTSDGRILLVAAGNDRTVRVWDPREGRPLKVRLDTATSGVVTAVTTWRSPDGASIVATGGADGFVRLWTIPTGELLQVIPIGTLIRSLHTAGPATVIAHLGDGFLSLQMN